MIRKRYLLAALMALFFLTHASYVCAQVDIKLERFVKKSGSPTNDGTSWNNALNNIQDAINNLRSAMQSQNITHGAIYVAAGTYNPTESTEPQNSNILNTSFLMYDGITIYGGYPADIVDGADYAPENREMKDTGDAYSYDVDGNLVVNAWDFKHKTILSGSHSGLEIDFVYNEARGMYDTRFPSNSFHVVWFGTKGEIAHETIKGHRQGFSAPAGIDGCVIEGGFASSKNLNTHDHMAYGGGVYMVENTFLRNCIIQKCQASQRGGGVYMDGGGSVDHCFIQQCQASGVAIAQGYGGGVCIDYNGSVTKSYMVQNAARIGGGLAICHTPNEFPHEDNEPYDPFAATCIISNNTSNAEGGGVYLDEGGTLNHCTVVKNRCTGPDIIYYGRRHGRSGGVYVRNCGMIYNSVFWGNKCPANSDIQFASIQQAGAATTGIDVFHSAFHKMDITDWSDVNKYEVYPLGDYNEPRSAGQNSCCWFEMNPVILDIDPEHPGEGSLFRDLKAGIDYDDETKVPKTAQVLTTWRPQHNSDLAMKGVQVSQTVHVNSEWIRHAHSAEDIIGRTFELVSTLGAFSHKAESNCYTLLKPQGQEGREGPDKDTPIPTIFVSSHRDNETLSAAQFYGPFGDSWEHSIMLLADAVSYFEQYRVKSGENKDKYNLPDPVEEGEPQTYTIYPAVQILVKEGTMTTAGRGSYAVGGDLRTAAIRPSSNMRFYGGYPIGLTGTETTGRNPGDHHTLVSCNIVGDFANSSAHAFALINMHDVIIDGIRMSYGNVTDMESDAIVKKGSGVMISNTTIAEEERIDMTGIVLRNCVITNTLAYDGAAIFVNAFMPKGDGSIVRAELDVRNTIIRNCTARQDDEMIVMDEYPGVIVANGNSRITLNHCTIANNEGYPLKTLAAGGFDGEIVIKNSALFANSRDEVDDRVSIEHFAATLAHKSGRIHGEYNMIDKDAPTDPNLTAVPTNQYILDTDNTSTNYPTFKNPSYNVGHSEGVERPLYGGTVCYDPLNKNPMVNAADDATMDWYDRTDTNHFNFGGAADIGAVENTNLPVNGAVLYVTPDGAGKRDGSSWSNAIAGNTVYVLDEVEGPSLASGDQLDAENNRVLDAAGNPVLTTDEKYCGGYGNSWFSSRTTGGTSTTTVTKTWTVEKNVWDDGDRTGEEEYIRNDAAPTVETETTPGEAGSPDNEFVAGFYNDPRYPYGEISGASRTFWRANPCVTAGKNKTTFMNAVDADGWINNRHEEKYVSGLQYAVEKASAYNILPENDPGRVAGLDSVQVWISNGKYTDYKGYVMRDKTTVIGSFPAVKGGSIKTPGLAERHALMSNVVSIPKAMVAEKLDPTDYETILQISDTDPKSDGAYTFNTGAVKFWDDDLVMIETSDTRTFEYKTHNIVHHYTKTDDTQTPVTTTYLLEPAFENKSYDEVNRSNYEEDGYHYEDLGSPVDGKDTWHLKYPVKTNYVVSIENDNKTNGMKRKIYNPNTNTQLTGTDATFQGNWIFLANGSMTDLELWQTIPNLPAGDYKLSVDMAGGYRNKFSSDAPTNINFHIIDANDSECIEPVMMKTIGNNDDRDNNRGMAYRYLLSFSQPKAGPLTIKVRIEDGVRNTTANGATSPVDPSGGDPDPIPNTYTTEYGKYNPNRREFWMSNIQLYSVEKGDYSLTSTDESTVDKDDVPPAYIEEDDEITSMSSTVGTHRTELRKRVLTMPDVTVPTYGPDRPVNSWGDDVSHTDRVPAGSVRDLRTAATLTKRSDSHYVAYSNVNWDGFTIRHGFIYDGYMAHGGGAGVNMYEGANLRNCVVINNVSASKAVKGGGIFCDGATSTIEGCFVLNNTSTQVTGVSQNQIFAGGMFMYEGTCFNSLFAKNYSYGTGGGLGFCVGRFYNNTVAYNTCDYTENGAKNGGALALATSSNPNLFIANTIIYGNNGRAIRERGDQIKMKDINPFIHCYIQSTVSQVQNYFTYHIGNHSENPTYYGVGNVFLNGVALSNENTPFEADLQDADGNFLGTYTGNASTRGDFRLHTGNEASCVNTGTEEFAPKLEEALGYKKAAGNYTGDIKTSYLYKNVEKVVLPRKDVAFADRIQDCSIDIGAYEYDGAIDIKPDTTTFANQKLAVFYVSENGNVRGDASASSPMNAACATKLQKILDAAGRYKYDQYAYPDQNHATTKDFTVVVALAGNTGENSFAYTPERTTEETGDADNVLAYSLIVPHGVQVWGGFYAAGTAEDPGFYRCFDGEGTLVSSSEARNDDGSIKEGYRVEMLRDILRYRTYFSGDVVSSTGAEGQAHHVVHFTEDLFDLNERKQEGQTVSGKLAVLTEEEDRAVLDGLFIINGKANGAPAGDGTVTIDMNGAAAIVPGFAHIRNCVIADNEASGYGGGLYLKPKALVSGTIIKNNTGRRGGGIYVEQPAGDVVNTSTFAYILTSTVVGNEASETGGGLYFESNLRANSSIFWHNSALDRNNVSGWLVQKSGQSSSVASVNYPLTYCGIESSRWEGVNNLLVSASETEGVRWDHQDYYEPDEEGTILYYPIEMSSVLARAGMTYDSYRQYCLTFPTLASTDIAGYEIMDNDADVTVTYDNDEPYSFVRKVKHNSLIDMGARVVNANFEVAFDSKHIMKRLYVVHTEDINSVLARDLQDNGYVSSQEGLTGTNEEKLAKQNLAIMYSQMGSCFANPFHRLGDALQYIINVRRSTQATTEDDTPTTIGEVYKNVRFEIFVTNGTFYPYRNAYGMEAASRSNTFVIPEGVTLVGGVDNTKNYGQPGYGTANTKTENNVTVPVKGKSDFALSTVSTDIIRQSREQSDLNMNNVVEPWELNKQTILSGQVVSGTESKNAYHVITCYSDPDKLGGLPTMYSDVACTDVTTDRKAESRESKARRTIFLDGITVSDGLANDITEEDEQAAFQRVTYFRGGGIFVDGNWDHVDENASYVPEVIGVANRDIPLVVTASQFQDNMAANGGAIYTNGSLLVTSSHFAQNSSRGPNTLRDQQYIPWTAGGAIATNYDCTLVNSIFANNEAKRGDLPIIINPAAGGVEMADIRQGFGGVVSASETSTVHALNCNFVRNKAVAFPAIYNFLCQSQKSHKTGDDYDWERGERKHWVVNSIFWGNEANTDVSAGGQIDSYVGANDDQGRTLGSLFTVAEGKTARKRADVANFGIEDRSEEVLFFCAYEGDYGLPSKLIVENDANKDAHKKTPVTTWDYFEEGTFVDEHPAEWSDGTGTHTNNQILSSDNNALSGPNFIQPSTKAGIEGYMQNADWLVSRLNRLIDTGWSYLPQEVTAEFDPEHGTDVFSTEFLHNNGGDRMHNPSLKGSGIYNFYSLRLDELYGGMGMADLAPLGEHPHMKYDQFGLKTGMNSTMRRISTYPKQGEQEVFIDIGVYEYQYVQLFIPGNAYDVIWVRPDNPGDGAVADGTTWAKATNNVQQAIDMLMSSHNDKDKVLKVRAGDYSPVYLTHGKLSFYIEFDGNANTILYPSAVSAGQELCVNSITIRGGYPNDETYMIPDKGVDEDDTSYDGENVRNPELFPARFIMSGSTGYEDRPEVKENLFVVNNVELQTTTINFISERQIDKQGCVMPVAFEGLTLSNPYGRLPGGESDNKEGAAILYMQQNKFNNNQELCGPPATRGETGYDVDGRPKLLIKDCIFLDNSNPAYCGENVAPAVHIMDGGGDAIVANSLFHSNGGEPLEGVNTKVINCTFALNAKPLTLTNDLTNGTGSVLHNSVIWKDNTEGSPYVFSDGAVLGKNNAILNAGLGDVADANGNQSLSETNNDILKGPNFTYPDATDPWKRDMHPRPTDRLMSKADKDTYKDLVPYYIDEPTCSESSMTVNGIVRTSTIQTVTRTLQKKSDPVYEDIDDWDNLWKNNELDLAHTSRFRGKGLERGPYEVQAAVQRVLYVNPSAMASTTSDGASWERAFTEGKLQDAIDAAGVYNATNGGQRAFVFVKGDGYTLSAPVTARDGVTVYGGVTDVVDCAVSGVQVDGDYTFDEAEIYKYINRVRAKRAGVATTEVASLLKGVTAEGTMSSGFLMDGFHFMNPDETLSESPIKLLAQKTVLRNSLVSDFNMSGSAPVVNIKDGLLYNSLLYGNDATTTVNVGAEATGGVLNCTVVAENDGQTAINSATASKVVNTITYNEANNTTSASLPEATVPIGEPNDHNNTKAGMFAPYLRDGANVYPYPFGDQRPLWYQLHERSECINGGNNTWSDYFSGFSSLKEGLTGAGVTDAGQKFIDFSQDRDVLGNPRMLFSTVDQGAFETWNITGNILATNETDAASCPVTNYGGHKYPHVGSVTYIGENANLCVKPGNFTSHEQALTVGYLLVKKGGSLYGQGNHVRFSYLAVERDFDDSDYVLFSLPYDWQQANVTTTAYTEGTDELTQTLKNDAFSTKYYDGAMRAAWDYEFHSEDSPCWKAQGTDNQKANNGYLLTMAASGKDKTLRFTSWGVDQSNNPTYIYLEHEVPSKTVTLTQHDEMPRNGYAHFTTNENMGWNLKGMPWLVSSYKTGDITDNSEEDYMMHVPHLFYDINGSTGSFSTKESWETDAVMALGDAYFTQTAIHGETEDLTFKLPVYSGAAPVLGARRMHLGIRQTASGLPQPQPAATTRGEVGEGTEPLYADVVEVRPEVGADSVLIYHFGSDGVKWMAFDKTIPQIYITNSGGARMSLLAAAPVEADIDLGVSIPEAGSYAIELPDREAYKDCLAVWLIDTETGQKKDLLTGNYTLTVTETGDIDDRLKLRFSMPGGVVEPEEKIGTEVHQNVLKVLARKGRLPLNQLMDDEPIQVYSVNGTLVFQGTVIESRNFSFSDGVYVIKRN